MKESHVILLLLVIGLGAGFAARHFLANEPVVDAAEIAEIEGLLWPDPPQVRDFELLDKAAEPFTDASLTGQWNLMFFGFTHCPDVCPATLRLLSEFDDALRAAEATPPRVVFVSVDPQRDDPATVRAYLDFFNPHVEGLTGSEEAVSAFTRRLGVIAVAGEADENGDYAVDHTASVLVIDPEGRLVGVLGAPHTVSNLKTRYEAIRAFVEASRR